MTFSDGERIKFRDEFEKLYPRKDSSTQKDLANKNKVLDLKIAEALSPRDKNFVYFEKCGFDNVLVDEAHHFNKLITIVRSRNHGESNEYDGIPKTGDSTRAKRLYAITQYIQNNNHHRNVFLLTATPFTNSPLEVYSMLCFIGSERLKKAGIEGVYDFLEEFAHMRSEMAVLPNGEIEYKQVMKDWKELPALQNLLSEYIDRVTADDAEIIRPKKFNHLIKLDMSELQKKMVKIDTDLMLDVSENPAVVITSMNAMRLALVAPALADRERYPELELPPLEKLVETSPKLKFTCDVIVDLYKEHPDKGQFMYLPLGKESHPIIKDYLVAHGIPKSCIEIINGEINNTVSKKAMITAKFNNPNDMLKIIIGGKNTCEGIDLNGNSMVMYNCCLEWNPTETIQAEGRIHRQGNLQGYVHCCYPVVNDSIDSLLYQKHDEKISRIDSLWVRTNAEFLDADDRIDPESLKFDLIKDPRKHAELEIDWETRDLRIEKEKIHLRVSSLNEIAEKYTEIKRNLNMRQEYYEDCMQEIDDYISERNVEYDEVPAYKKQKAKDAEREFKRDRKSLENIQHKFDNMGIKDFSQLKDKLNALSLHETELEIRIDNIQKKLPEYTQKYYQKLKEQEKDEYPIEEQEKKLAKEISSTLKPFEEIRPELKKKFFEEKISRFLKMGDISNEQYEMYKSFGYKAYDAWKEGFIETITDYREGDNENIKSTFKSADGIVEPPKNKNNDEQKIAMPLKGKRETSNEVKTIIDENGQLCLFASESDSMSSYNAQITPLSFKDSYAGSKEYAAARREIDESLDFLKANEGNELWTVIKDFKESGVCEILDRKISVENRELTGQSYSQLNKILEIYRSKKFETARYVLIDRYDGRIREQVALSCNMPNSTCFDVEDNVISSNVLNMAKEMNCKVVAVHNHPSGNISPSIEDKETTLELENLFGDYFGGHMILDHDTFSLYTKSAGWNFFADIGVSRDNLVKDYPEEWMDDFSLTGTKDVLKAGIEINSSNNWNDKMIPVIFTDANSKIKGLRYYSSEILFDDSIENIKNLQSIFENDAKTCGSMRAFGVVTEKYLSGIDYFKKEKLYESSKTLVRNSILVDVCFGSKSVYEKIVDENKNFKVENLMKNINKTRVTVNSSFSLEL